MRSKLFVVLVTTVLTLFAVTGLTLGRAEFVLEMATFWSAGDIQVVEGHMRWIQEIEKRTDGRVQIHMHAGQALLTAPEIYEGVAQGVAHIGTTCPSYTPGVFPLTEAFELPGFENPNALSASLTVHEAYKRMKEMGYDEYSDTKILMFWATGPGAIKTVNQPVHTLEDLRGLELRSAGGGSNPTIQALGAVPVGMPMSEAYLGLEQGIVDGILGPYDTLEVWRLGEVVDYATQTEHSIYNIVFVKAMNLHTWNALPSDIQEIIEEVSEEYVMKYGELRTDCTNDGLDYGMREHGFEVITLSPEEEARWLERLEMVVDDWITHMESRGLPGQTVIDLIRELDQEYAEQYGSYGE